MTERARTVADDVRAIERLMHTYAARFDAADFRGVAELFRYGPWDAKGLVCLTEADGLEEHLAATYILHRGLPRTKHLTTNVMIDVDQSQTTARAESLVTVFQAVKPDFPLQVIACGRYDDRFEHVDGAWRFAVRRATAELLGDLSRHLRTHAR